MFSSITVTTGTYVEVIEAVQRDALDSMSSLFPTDDSAADTTGYGPVVLNATPL